MVEGENPVTSETPKIVTSDSSGNISPTSIWSIPEDASVTHHEYDIVMDKEDDGSNTGIYNSDSDGIDSADVFGFTAPVPEISSFVLVGVGIFSFVGLLRWKGQKRVD
ncbi:MAG: hypothetical protein SVJ22_06535 [Halobacteriota archaeon]|nr:hypothetical protein [Halobacteriota archaeon]